jgi:hypothetical protein
MSTSKQPKRPTVVTCRINGVAVSLEELAQELVRCGGIVAKTNRGSK